MLQLNICRISIILLFSFSLIVFCQCTKLNVPKVLLPYTTRVPVNFTLHTEKGCYKWVSSRPEWVQVYPLSSSSSSSSSSFLLPSSCSQQALVSALSTSQSTPTRGGSVIQAQENVTGHVLRCDVIVDKIHSIQIITTTRRLFSDDPPLHVSVLALDSGGNTFSSLAGLEFDWWLAKNSDQGDTARFVRFSDAGYSAPPHILSLEEMGLRGDRVLLQGVHSGSAHIRVSLSHADLKVEAASVSLSVMDRLYLSPGEDVYLLLGSAITYSVWRSQHGKDREVILSEEGYELVVEGYGDRNNEDDIISIDQNTATITALQLGHATFTISHHSLPEDSASYLPHSTVYVVEPSYLTLHIQEEDDRWVLETGRQYRLTIQVHDNEGHVTHLSQNVGLIVEVCERFSVLDSTTNLSYHLLLTHRTGHTAIQASLYTVFTEDGRVLPLNPPIRVRQEVDVYDPLTLKPSILVFPWQHNNELYQLKIQVEGGSGTISWDVSDSDVAMVTVEGVVLAGKKRGQTEIRASDTQNPLHRAVGEVYVVRPGRLELLPQKGDCEVGEKIELPLALWGVQDNPNTPSHTNPNTDTHSHTRSDNDAHTPSHGESLLPVTDCSLLSLHVHTDPATVFTNIPGLLSPSPGFCGGIQLEAVAPGHTLVTVTVETEAYNISATATLAAYSPLKALVSSVLLSVGSSRLIVFEGGPQPWTLAPTRFYSDVLPEPAGGVTVETHGLTDVRLARYVYRVTCTARGEQWLVFRCGNTAGPLNEVPSVEESRVRVECGIPANLSLSPFIPSSSSSHHHPSIPPSSHHLTCPHTQYPSSLLSVSCSRDTVLQLSVFDQKGEQFDNFTSCLVSWVTSDPALLSLTSRSTVADIHTERGHKLHARQLLKSHGLTGIVTVTVTLSSPQMQTAPISVSVDLRLVEDVMWDVRSVTLYNHPKVSVNLTLVQGSGHFLVRLQDKELANMTHLESTNTVQLFPLRPGFSSLLVHDLCLTSPDPAVTSVIVSDVADFQIDFLDIVEVGHTALVRVRVLDAQKQPFLHHFLSLMELTLIPSSSIVTVEEVGQLDQFSVGFHVSGQAVGVVSLHLSAVDGSGRVISSSHRSLQVYPRFTLQPRKLALTLGSVRQVKWEGGPHPQSTVGFSVSDSRIATVTETGLVRGLAVGVVKLRGALQTVTQDTGALLTFAQDEVEVEVFNLTGVRIQTPLVRLSVGTEMPVFVMGSDSGQNPLALGSVESGLTFHWSLGKLGVLEIKPRHTQAGIRVSPAHSFSVLIKALAPGRTSLKVCVQPGHTHTKDGNSPHSDDQLTDEIQILVFEEMKLAAGSPSSILMSPFSQYALQSNKDTICPVRYALCQCVTGAGLVTVDDRGVLRAGHDTGHALLEVVAMESCGVNQTLLISVKVATVWFVRVFAESVLYSRGESLPAFPLGWSFRITALCYNNLGHQFHAHNTYTRVITNRDDLVLVTPDSDSHSFLVQTVSPGLTILGIQADPTNPSLSDFTPLPVLPAITAPAAALRPGDTVCFNSPLTDERGQPGRWDASSSRTLRIDPETGAALARHAGTAVVFYRLEGGQQALREVTVENPAIPAMSPPKGQVLTNWPLASDYTVRVELYTSSGNLAQCTLNQREAIEKTLQPEVGLQCILHFSAPHRYLTTLQSVFSTASLYDMDTAQYGCRISVKPQSDSVLHLLSSLSFSASLSASLRGHSAPPGYPPSPLSFPSSPPPAELPYLPAFYCPHAHISLSSQQPLAQITVYGTKDMLWSLRFVSDNPYILLSEPSPSEEDHTLLLLSVYTSSDRFRELAPPLANITLYTHLSPQTHVVMVTTQADNKAETNQLEAAPRDSSPFHQWLNFQFILVFVIFAVLATTAALVIVYNTMLSQMQTVPVVYMPTVTKAENRSTCSSPWISPSQPHDRNLRRRYWLWSANTRTRAHTRF